MPFVIAPLEDVKGVNGYPEYRNTLKDLEREAIKRANSTWTGQVQGGITPQGNQYGIGPFRKNDMAADTTAATPSGSYSFRRTATATGWADIFNYTTRDDFIQAFAGFAFLDAALQYSQIRVVMGQRRFPIWDLQEAHRYEKFAVILKSDAAGELVVDPKTTIQIRGYVETTGTQRIVPLGFQLFRRADLVINET